VKLTPEQILKLRQQEQSRGQRVTVDQMQKQINAPQPPFGADPTRPAGPHGRPAGRGRDDEGGGGDDDRKRGGSPGGPGAVAGRDARHKARQDKGRNQGGGTFSRGAVVISGGQVETVDERFGSRRGPRAALLRKMMRGKQKVQTKKEGRIEIDLPITVRSLSETIGMKSGELLLKLKNLTNSLYTINSNLEFEVAEMIAIDRGVELVARKQETAEDIMYARLKKRAEESDPANLTLRPPVVTIMGHVDHGKTSLLDKIRQQYGLASDVVSTEAGGITQVLRAWRVEKDGKSTTFLDTPGHEAFTKMRARGADVTDIVVIVVSASDGVMPQTEEAISHARAAEVDIIVAINKIDLPDANIERTRRQLYQLNLLPDNMGGDVPFVECSAKTGQGIGELLDNIATLAELAELKADPTLAASGTCLEAYLEGDRGVMATLLVENGTLRKGDIVLCGSSYGRVRAMYDDHGRPTDEAGPSTPVKFIGLDEVPDADDEFLVVDDIGTAREIAEARKEAKQQALLAKFSPVSLDKLKEANAKVKITELKVILKAEARGSVEAIKKELEKLVHEEVRVRVLHAGIGAITESDVTLALTSPENTILVGFNVTADDAALALAEARGISIREYQIIYNLVDDVKAALEGRLKPVEEVVHLGRAIVRATFKVSKVGTIAGCFVTSGTIERNAKVRVIRDGTVLFPPAERSVGLDSLKRFKDDAKEVREGFECGLKVAGFDDVKVGDVIEAYRIEIKQRTL
jgi:translation initiation factor IF-2